jgi:hypothetical protein
MSELHQKVSDAYRAEHFAQASTVEATLDAGGLLFGWKRGRAGRFTGLHVVADIAEQRIRFRDFHDGRDGLLAGHDVWLEPVDGTPDVRRDARSRFPYRGRLLRWDELDMMYFLGYALWNYFTFPALLHRPGVDWTQSGDHELTAVFPADLATHCPEQRFRFDPSTSLVVEHDYTAEVFGSSWAHACHLTQDYQVSDGFPFASRRRVHPSHPVKGGAMKTPLLIWADVHEFEVG